MQTDTLLPSIEKDKRAYILYATASYHETVQACVNSLRTFSKLPIYVYMINCHIPMLGATTFGWECDAPNIKKQEKFIDRADPDIYKMMIQRPLIVKDCLENYAETVAFIDADCVATQYVDNIFDYYSEWSRIPHFVEGIYDYLHIDGRGGADTREDMSTTLEAPACDLFNVNQYVRQTYRQTGFFVAGQETIPFLNTWYNMCSNPKVIENHTLYAPYHEETIANVLLWKYEFFCGLPYIYTNASLKDLPEIYEQDNWGKEIRPWFKIPKSSQELLFIHGEKDPIIMEKMIEYLKQKKLKIMFLAPHLSTGGMPQFLLKRIECLQNFTKVEISVVEYQNYSLDYVVQRDKIKKIVDKFYTLGENKLDLFGIIKDNKPDIIHIDEMSERLDREMINQLYSNDRSYRIVEICHDISFDPKTKVFHPDAYAFCTPYHLRTFKDLPSYKESIEYPIDKWIPSVKEWSKRYIRNSLGMEQQRIHVLNVGLWTPGKNQAEGILIAKNHPDMRFHFVGNQAPNFKEYWEPLMQDLPPNVTVWGERNDTDRFFVACDIFMFNSKNECNPIVLREAISYGLPIMARNLLQYEGMFNSYIYDLASTDIRYVKAFYEIPTNNTSKEFAEKHLNFYNEIMNKEIKPQKKVKKNVQITQHFVDQPFIEITGNEEANFLVKFLDEKGICQYEETIGTNHWIKLSRSYFTSWTTQVFQDKNLIYENIFSLKNRKVFIVFESSSLGDTIAWMPYVLKFQEKHKCQVVVSTFKNFLFQKAYPELQFVEPGTVVYDLYALYRLGWFYDKDKEPEIPNTIPLQKTATNILGLKYEEIVPRIHFEISSSPCNKKYITIAPDSTAGCKYWRQEEWQKLVDYLIEMEYVVINVSKEENTLNNVDQLSDNSLENTIRVINHSDYFIGLSSGLSWLAWALDTSVVMIANFTETLHEFQSNCIRISNKNVCHGCWNNRNFKFDKGDWNWCPIYKDTPRQFECQKSITAEMVIEQIKIFGI